MEYRIDILRVIDNNIRVNGWALPKDRTKVADFKILDNKNKEYPFELVRQKRLDIVEYYKIDSADTNYGFDITFEINADEEYELLIIADNKTSKYKLSRKIVDRFNSFSYRKRQKMIEFFNADMFKRAFSFLMTEGLIAFITKSKKKVESFNVEYDYDEWYRIVKTNEKELDRQKKQYEEEFKTKPLFSIIIPIYNTKKVFLKKLFYSILNQTYQNFEIIVADATDYTKINNNPANYIKSLKDDRIKIKTLKENKSISDNTNEALKLATGDYIILCDHDDELTLDALYECTKVINENEEVNFIYSDEDKVDMSDTSYFEPNFKPDFNLDMFLSVNYISHLCCFKKQIVDELINKYGEFERNEYNGAQDYDLYLRVINLLIDKNKINTIKHIPQVLYHWRCHNESTSKNINSKTYAFESGKKALSDFYNNTKMNFPKVIDVIDGFSRGLYKAVFEKIKNEPLISVIIPNKDHIEDLDLCIKSLQKSIYKNYEIIIIENNSTDNKTFDYYKQIEQTPNIKVVYYKDIFNYSKINNFGVKESKGDYILFLNNDTEMINENSLEEMMNYLLRDDVGIVGSKLLYKDNTIQHAGVIIGFGGIAGHTFIGKYDKASTYMNRANVIQDLNAVTAACLMIKKSVFEEVNGFTEELAVAFNDIDLCMKVRAKNHLVVYNPYSCFYHYESKSRGLEDNEEKVKRFNREVAIFLKRWKEKVDSGDEYYNRNLTLRKSDFSLRNLNFEKIGEPYKMDKEIYDIMESL